MFFIIVLAVTTACNSVNGIESDGGMDAATDTDSDTDTDTDSDTDTDTDSDTDTDTDSDTDTDTDTDSDTDTDTDLDGGPDAFVDAGPFFCGGTFYDPRDWKGYATVQIGSKCWFAQNINIGTMIPSSSTPSDNSIIEKYCFNDNAAGCSTYGGHYAWDEMMDYNPSDTANPSTTQGICPLGWHLPSDEEIKSLEVQLGMTVADADLTNTWRGDGPGTAMKNGGSSGLDHILAGRFSGGVFVLQGSYEFFWTATDFGSYGWRRCLNLSATGVGRYNNFPKATGCTVRCAMD